MKAHARRQGYAEIPLDLQLRNGSANGSIVAIQHQGTRVLLLLDSGESLPLTLAEARRIIDQTKKNIVGWVATYDGVRLTLVEEVAR